MSSYVIRPAVEADQATIKALIRAVGINPMDLHWPHFLVAEDGGRIIGIGQVKTHGDGSRELASIAVIRERRREGIAAAIIQALLVKESGTLFLTCQKRMEGYYARFGFRRIDTAEMTPYFRKLIWVMNIPGAIASMMSRGEVRLIVMKRDQPAANT
jgi:N-acetylglutamate synthase-like GNAT family acetyltransferase